MKFDYIEQYEKLHKQDLDYGASASRYLPEICLLIDYLKPKTILDYGCGKGALSNALIEKYPDIKIYKYDPAIPEYNEIPVEHVDMLICQDVLEHIPEEFLPKVIEEIKNIADNALIGLFHIKSGNILPNGEDAHCTIQPPEWYKELIGKYYNKVEILKGRFVHQTNAITFEINDEIKKQYYKLMAKGFIEYKNKIDKYHQTKGL